MAKISRTVREAINTSIFLIVVALLVVTYCVYPLMKTETISARHDVEEIYLDSLPLNDPTFYNEAGLVVDTFRVESDGLTNLALLYLPLDSTFDTTLGTVFLLNKSNNSRDSLLELAATFHDAGYLVVVYDQRASGYSSGMYRGEGQLEADDLTAVISFLNLRDKIYYPLSAVGFDLGGDAAMLASLTNAHITKVVAVNPYLTTLRMQNILKDKHDMYWFPFYRTIMWFWYGMRSGNASEYREIENLKPTPCTTLLFVDENYSGDDEISKLKEIADMGILNIQTASNEKQELYRDIFNFVNSIE